MQGTISVTTSLLGSLSTRTTFQSIQDALFGGVYQIAATVPVAWDNVDYVPTLGTEHWQVFMAPRPVLPASVGLHGMTEHRGVVQINVRVPVAFGPNHAVVQADRIAGYFRRGLALTSGTTQVRIIGTSRGSMMIDKAWATLPVSIAWRCHSPE